MFKYSFEIGFRAAEIGFFEAWEEFVKLAADADSVWAEIANELKNNPSADPADIISRKGWDRSKTMHFHPDRLQHSSHFTAAQKAKIENGIKTGRINLSGKAKQQASAGQQAHRAYSHSQQGSSHQSHSSSGSSDFHRKWKSDWDSTWKKHREASDKAWEEYRNATRRASHGAGAALAALPIVVGGAVGLGTYLKHKKQQQQKNKIKMNVPKSPKIKMSVPKAPKITVPKPKMKPLYKEKSWG